jgi:activating signal cointegrator 1
MCMKAISIWQPFASLIVTGCKIFETRTWAPPASLIGQRVAIASTKIILPAQRAHWADPEFQRFYAGTALPAPEELPRGYLLGHARLDSVELMDEELMEDVSPEEQSYGWWEPGNYAWRMVDPVALAHPIPVRGKQGIWVYEGDLEHAERQTQGCQAPGP